MRQSKRWPRVRTLIVALAVLLALSIPAEVIALDQPVTAQAPAPVTYRFEETVWIANTGTSTAYRVRVDVPLMAALDSSMQEVVATSFSPEPVEITTLPNGNRIASFAIDALGPGERLPLRQAYEVRLTAQAVNAAVKVDDLAPYLATEAKIESDSAQIKAIARQVAPQGEPQTPDEVKATARAAYDYVRRTLKYNLQAPSANKGALAGLQLGEGSCVEYASLFVAILRAAGVPARIVNGFASDVKPLADYTGADALRGRRHQWAEFYVEGEGWLPVDPTLANAKNDLFGSLPAGYYVIQNYGDNPARVRGAGGKLGGSFQYTVTASR